MGTKRQIKKAIRQMRIAYKKSLWVIGVNTLLLSELIQNYWLKYEGGVKPEDTPF
jgi:hypothetical protein